MTHPKALLLDAMGTLIGLRRSVGSSYAALAAVHGLQLDAAAIDAVFPKIYRAAPPLAFPGLGGEELEQAERNWWSERIRTCLEACGVSTPMPAALGSELFDHFASADPWQVYADVEDHLRLWRQRGCRLVVVSNFDQRLGPLLASLGLADLLDGVVVSSVVGAAKPDPRPFERALELLQLPAPEVWHIGDSPEDEAGANAAGIRCVLIRRQQPAQP